MQTLSILKDTNILIVSLGTYNSNRDTIWPPIDIASLYTVS